MPFASEIFGLRVLADRPVPGLPETAEGQHPDVTVSLSGLPGWASAEAGAARPFFVHEQNDAASGLPVLAAWWLRAGAFLLLRYGEGADFLVDRAGGRVWAGWRAPVTPEDVGVWIVGPVLGVVLHLRGTSPLHGSAVAAGGRAVAFVGPSGAGKSTLAAGLARRGLAVIADDVLALCDGPDGVCVQPAYPRLKLWPDSVRAVYGEAASLPRLVPESTWWDKRFADAAGQRVRFEERRLLLGAVYFLDARTAAPGAPEISTLSPRDALLAAVANTYMQHLTDAAMQARALPILGRALEQACVRRLTPSPDSGDLDRLCDAVLADLGLSPLSPGAPRSTHAAG